MCKRSVVQIRRQGPKIQETLKEEFVGRVTLKWLESRGDCSVSREKRENDRSEKLSRIKRSGREKDDRFYKQGLKFRIKDGE